MKARWSVWLLSFVSGCTSPQCQNSDLLSGVRNAVLPIRAYVPGESVLLDAVFCPMRSAFCFLQRTSTGVQFTCTDLKTAAIKSEALFEDFEYGQILCSLQSEALVVYNQDFDSGDRGAHLLNTAANDGFQVYYVEKRCPRFQANVDAFAVDSQDVLVATDDACTEVCTDDVDLFRFSPDGDWSSHRCVRKDFGQGEYVQHHDNESLIVARTRRDGRVLSSLFSYDDGGVRDVRVLSRNIFSISIKDGVYLYREHGDGTTDIEFCGVESCSMIAARIPAQRVEDVLTLSDDVFAVRARSDDGSRVIKAFLENGAVVGSVRVTDPEAIGGLVEQQLVVVERLPCEDIPEQQCLSQRSASRDGHR